MAKFDPKAHLMKVQGGADYLETKWRLVWFRETWPHGTIETEALEWSDQRAVFRATVTAVDGEGNIRGKATGTKSCTAKQFPRGHIEKAETGAIGRALACLGFGTQFEPEFDEGDLLADSPVQPNMSVQAPQRPQDAPKPANAGTSTPPVNLDREKVMRALHATGKDAGMEHIDLHNLIVAKGHDSMTTAPVEALVDLGKAIKADPGKLKAWLAKQAELMPSPDDVPNPERFTQ